MRHLEHFIERSVILSEGSELRAPLAELGPHSELGSDSNASLRSMRREHIVKMLRETRGVISGTNGAAARLGLKRTTSQSIMQSLGITRKDYED